MNALTNYTTKSSQIFTWMGVCFPIRDLNPLLSTKKRGLPNVASAAKKTVKKCNSEKLCINTKHQNNAEVINLQSTLITLSYGP